MKVIIWGTGNTANILRRHLNYEVVEVVAYTDNNVNEEGLYINSVPLIYPHEIKRYLMDIDYILIASRYYKDIQKQLNEMMGYGGVDSNKIKQVFDIDLYRNDEVIRKITTYNFYSTNHEYMIGNYIIDLGEKCKLPMYQRNFPLYDKFLFRLAAIFKGSENWLIDIGANVGDTVMSFRTNSDCSILAVEPAGEFYELLVKNTYNMENKGRIELAKYFVTDDESKKYIANFHEGGTANMQEVSENYENVETSSISMERLMALYSIDWRKILLIKTDTDGFDYKCILSCNEQLKNTSALLFFEQCITDRNNLCEYNKMYDYLERMGYEVYYIFDNYGNFLLRGSKEVPLFISEYLIRGIEGVSKLTFEYIDVLACKKNNMQAIEALMKEYYFEPRE